MKTMIIHQKNNKNYSISSISSNILFIVCRRKGKNLFRKKKNAYREIFLIILGKSRTLDDDVRREVNPLYIQGPYFSVSLNWIIASSPIAS